MVGVWLVWNGERGDHDSVHITEGKMRKKEVEVVETTTICRVTLPLKTRGSTSYIQVMDMGTNMTARTEDIIFPNF